MTLRYSTPILLVLVCGTMAKAQGVPPNCTMPAHSGGNCNSVPLQAEVTEKPISRKITDAAGNVLSPQPAKGSNYVETKKRICKVVDGGCWSAAPTDKRNCPCSYEQVPENEVTFQRRGSSRVVKASRISVGLDIFGVGTPKAKFGLGRTTVVNTKTPWREVSSSPTTKNVCECDGNPLVPTGATPGPGPVRETGPRVPGGTTPPVGPPPFGDPPAGGGQNVPVGGTTPTLPTGSPGFPAVPGCRAANDVQEGSLRWDKKTDYTYDFADSPLYVSHVDDACNTTYTHDRVRFIKRVTITATLKGQGTCKPKDTPHDHGGCDSGCDIGDTPSTYTEIWTRELISWTPTSGSWNCSISGTVVVVTGIAAWTPVFSQWQLAVSSSGSNRNLCSCEEEGGGDPDPGGGTTPGHEDGDGGEGGTTKH